MNTQPRMAVFHFQERMASLTEAMGKKFAKTPKGCEK